MLDSCACAHASRELLVHSSSWTGSATLRRAVEAQQDARLGDMRASFSGRTQSSAARAVRRADGSLTSTDNERQLRWQEHFTKVFADKVVPMSDLAAATPTTVVSTSPLCTSPESVRVAVLKLGRKKGVGHDVVPAELLQAGGYAAAVKLHELYSRIIATG
eukprot:14455234-Heterocapsa_arctica.AAC.1